MSPTIALNFCLDVLSRLQCKEGYPKRIWHSHSIEETDIGVQRG